MKKAHVRLGLVILGVVAIIAVVGLVLLFTRASKTEGAYVVSSGYGQTYGGIGKSYSWYRDRGQASKYPIPKGVTPYGAPLEYPAMAELPILRVNSRIFPAYIIEGMVRGAVPGLEDAYGKCKDDLLPYFQGGSDAFTEWVQPTWQVEAGQGNLPGASASYPQPPIPDPTGTRGASARVSTGRTGGGTITVYADVGGYGDGTQTPAQLSKGISDRIIGLVDGGYVGGKNNRPPWGKRKVQNSLGEIRYVANCRAGMFVWPYPN